MKGMKLLGLCGLCLLALTPRLFAYDAWLIPIGDRSYAEADDLYIESGRVPPFMETPAAAETMKSELDAFAQKGSTVLSPLQLPRPAISFFLDAALDVGTLNDPWLYNQIATKRYDDAGTGTWVDGGTTFTDYNGIYEILDMPPLLSLGILAHSEHFSILFNPTLRASTFGQLRDYSYSNLPSDIVQIDMNFPYRGIATFWSGEFEARIGRDKLNLGPGRWSTLIVSKNMPYFDYGMAAFKIPGFRFSGYVISLNPTLSSDENDYIDAIVDGTEINMEQNSAYTDSMTNVHFKVLTVGRFTFEPWRWLTIAIEQTNLIGGRYPSLADLNPLIVFHNLFEEGFYSVPVSLSFGLTPIAGLYFYGEYVLYDVSFGDEAGLTTNPDASAYQIGLTALSRPWLDLGPGRLRLDCEWSYASPWMYNKYTDLRKFTSRIIFVEPYYGRYWVDFPLGFYRGPDCWELNTKLSYGPPGGWEAFLHWQHTVKGEGDLYGYGEDSDYATVLDFVQNGLVTGIPEIRDRLSLEGSWPALPNLSLGFRVRWTNVQSANHVPGNDGWFFDVGTTVRWKVF
jgi:hypothetical protein